MGMLRLEGDWQGDAVAGPLELVGQDLRVEQLPQLPSGGGSTDVFKAAFALPVERLEDRGCAWTLESPAGERIDVEWPSAEQPAALQPSPDAAASVARAAAEALLEAHSEGERLVHEKEAEIQRLRGDLREAMAIVARADEKVDAAQEASTAMSRRLRHAEHDAEDARQALREIETAADQPRAELARERARVVELEASAMERESLREESELELGSAVEKLAAALDSVRAAEGAAAASQVALATERKRSESLERLLGEQREAVARLEGEVASPAEARDADGPDDGALDALRMELVAATERATALAAELDGRDAREAAQRAALATMEEELVGARAEADTAHAEAESAHAEAQAAHAEAEAAHAEAEAAHAEAEAAHAEAEAVQAEAEATGEPDTQVADLREAVAALESELDAARAATAATANDSHLVEAQGSLELEAERRTILEAEVTELRAAVERLEGERDAARASGGDADAEAALVNERQRANGLERLLAERDRGERDLHQRIMELEGDLRVTTARATSMEAELANLSDGISVERSTPIVAMGGAADPAGTTRRPAVRAGSGNPEDFATRLERANEAIQRVQDRSS
ncbi:MAG: hypothetical protein QOD53_283 [Thermoleophilaceae bacterium]|nr:hypothetical protein [Thermoleophilaceae bacterium]